MQQVEFIEKHYPFYRAEAYVGVIYTCNMCVVQMGRAKWNDAEVIEKIQKLYRKYGKYYLKANVSKKGKLLR